VRSDDIVVWKHASIMWASFMPMTEAKKTRSLLQNPALYQDACLFTFDTAPHSHFFVCLLLSPPTCIVLKVSRNARAEIQTNQRDKRLLVSQVWLAFCSFRIFSSLFLVL
jgi:hypothetical protein